MKVSILVPVYGVERYIEACAVSLFEQTYEDLEYVFVDDCSPDSSISILQKTAARYPHRQHQIRIIRNQTNKGSGETRAVALAAATGDFVMYVDSDDVVMPDAVSRLCEHQQLTQADIVDGAYCRLSGKGPGPAVLPFHGNSSTLIRLMIAKNTTGHNLWGRLIRKSLHTSHGITFKPGINMAEDYSVMPRLLFYANRTCIDDVIYQYRINDSGTFAAGLNRSNIFSFLGANRIIGEFLQLHDPDGNFRFAYELGMMQTYWSAFQVGLSRRDIDDATGYRPASLLFRSIHALLGRPAASRELHRCYLAIKWFYKKTLSL